MTMLRVVGLVHTSGPSCCLTRVILNINARILCRCGVRSFKYWLVSSEGFRLTAEFISLQVLIVLLVNLVKMFYEKGTEQLTGR